MILYVVRHAFAGQHGDPRYPDDSLRPVTRKGNKRFRRLVKHLAAVGVAPQVVGTSPYRRCVQTAITLVEQLELACDPQKVEAFAPGCDWSDVFAWLATTPGSDAAYVGHAPDVEAVAAAALGCRPAAVRMAKGAVAAIDFVGPAAAGEGTLRWLATPRLFD